MLHKPVGFITTLDDPEGRRTVRELIPPGPRLFPVGRLDADSSGLLLLTNDGDLAHHLMHPRYGVPKLYRVTLGVLPDDDTLRRLRAGVEIEPGLRSAPSEVRVQSARRDRPAIEIRIQEGRYREVRKMCEMVGLTVRKLHRFGYGPLRLEKLPVGACRELSAQEVQRLRTTGARPGGSGPPARPPSVRLARPKNRPAAPKRGPRARWTGRTAGAASRSGVRTRGQRPGPVRPSGSGPGTSGPTGRSPWRERPARPGSSRTSRSRPGTSGPTGRSPWRERPARPGSSRTPGSRPGTSGPTGRRLWRDRPARPGSSRTSGSRPVTSGPTGGRLGRERPARPAGRSADRNVGRRDQPNRSGPPFERGSKGPKRRTRMGQTTAENGRGASASRPRRSTGSPRRAARSPRW